MIEIPPCTQVLSQENSNDLLRAVANQLQLFIMRPHADNLYGLDIFQELVNQSMLNVDPSGIGAGQITYKFFVWWGIFKGIFF